MKKNLFYCNPVFRSEDGGGLTSDEETFNSHVHVEMVLGNHLLKKWPKFDLKKMENI